MGEIGTAKSWKLVNENAPLKVNYSITGLVRKLKKTHGTENGIRIMWEKYGYKLQ